MEMNVDKKYLSVMFKEISVLLKIIQQSNFIISKNVRNIKHSYCYWAEKEFQQRLDFVNSIIRELQ